MFKFIKRISCFESRMDARIENSIRYHQGFKLFIIYIGLPLFTLAAACICTTIGGPVPGVPVWLDVNGFIKCLTKKWIS